MVCFYPYMCYSWIHTMFFGTFLMSVNPKQKQKLRHVFSPQSKGSRRGEEVPQSVRDGEPRHVVHRLPLEKSLSEIHRLMGAYSCRPELLGGGRGGIISACFWFLSAPPPVLIPLLTPLKRSSPGCKWRRSELCITIRDLKFCLKPHPPFPVQGNPPPQCS